jgi:hypothetical protein
MKTNTADTTPARGTARKMPILAILLAMTALLSQGCTTARLAWSHPAEGNPVFGGAFERMEPREGIALVNFNF